MKKFFLFLLFVLFSINIYSDSVKDQLFKELFSSLYDVMDLYVQDYTRISGLYTTGSAIKGSADIGNFPSFRIGVSAGVLFFNNPFRCLKSIKYGNSDWDDFKDNWTYSSLLNSIDQSALPIPLTNIDIQLGLVKNMWLGFNLHITDYGAFVKSGKIIDSNCDSGECYHSEFVKEVWYTGFGINYNYTILKDFKYFPSISIGTGFSFGVSRINIQNIKVAEVYIDSFNPAVPVELGMCTTHYITSFFFDFTISKRIKFFIPFLSARFIQSVNYNESYVSISLDMQNVTSSTKELYGSGNYTISNLSIKEGETKQSGVVTPASDFILSAGFEFAVSIVRFGFQCNFGVVSQKSMISIGLRLHAEDWNKKNNN